MGLAENRDDLWSNTEGIRPYYGQGIGKGHGGDKRYSSERSEEDAPTGKGKGYSIEISDDDALHCPCSWLKGKGKSNHGDGAAGIADSMSWQGRAW